jgi:hypothetical protein
MSPEDCRSHLASVELAPDWVSFPSDTDVTLNNLRFSGPTRLLHHYLLEAGWVEELD